MGRRDEGRKEKRRKREGGKEKEGKRREGMGRKGKGRLESVKVGKSAPVFLKNQRQSAYRSARRSNTAEETLFVSMTD